MMKHNIPLPDAILAKIKERAADQGNIKWAKSFDKFVENHFKQFPDLALTLHHATTGVSTEAGELLSVSKAAWVYGREIDHETVIEEAFDTLFYLQAIINLYDLRWEEVVVYGVGKLRQRYPDGFNEQAANDRADKQEPWLKNEGAPDSSINPLDLVEVKRGNETVEMGMAKDFDWQSKSWPSNIVSYRRIRPDSKT